METAVLTIHYGVKKFKVKVRRDDAAVNRAVENHSKKQKALPCFYTID